MKNFEKHLWLVIKNKNVTKGAKKAALKKLAEVQRNQGII